MIRTYAPGKLFIAGEYAVVEPGYPAILVAVDRGIVVLLEEMLERGELVPMAIYPDSGQGKMVN